MLPQDGRVCHFPNQDTRQNLKVFILANVYHYFFNILIYLADLSSLLGDRTVIEEEEMRGSSSDSSTCLVGTTTQGLDGTAPQKGEIFNVKRAECSVQKQKNIQFYCVAASIVISYHP